jgi:hypothetical protein
MLDDLYCKIYVDTTLSEEELIHHIANFTKGDVHVRTVETDMMGIGIIENEDYDDKFKSEQNNFVCYRYYLEIDASDLGLLESNKYIDLMSDLLEFLWSTCEDAVPSCDYEEKLPSRKNLEDG